MKKREWDKVVEFSKKIQEKIELGKEVLYLSPDTYSYCPITKSFIKDNCWYIGHYEFNLYSNLYKEYVNSLILGKDSEYSDFKKERNQIIVYERVYLI